MKTIIYMVRHGESPYNEGNERTRGLTPKGKADIEKVTKLLIDEGIDLIISSPYNRAILSVEGLAEHLNLDIKVFEDLRERHFAADMIENTELMASIRESFNNPDYTLPGGESNADCQKRAIAVLKSILNEHKGKRMAIGTHGLVMTLMMNHFDPVYGLQFLNQLKKPDIYKMLFEDLELKEVTRLWND
ncbi:2,3-bisphosphoglycerate-dependent phosphoglycerate mutase [Paenibacillus sp. UNCCL117]|uniref:histidine phosphatase family protein n=1 Tax=unclassified Paenibacillus TaxID=185978 RepID=UPI00088B609D|nr:MULTISPECIES: histidine phosphatase family protein [unclassified Paenibacillus]SDE43187.1 2,3-bisphosphoglycerate-dependent phosphoglycerate mutase [Paenibacillus sp. cl123]SFW45935.1 2,3-bisphosphoglycerate-dependent phosphoglycerate mutase [Paenibacillus sp. UNCCL117]